MNYKIIDIEGIGEVYAAKLAAVGVKSTNALLDKCSTPKGRKEMEEATGIGHELILKWTNHADLMRVKGVAGQFAELLEAAGVDTVKELRNRKADNLQAKLAEINEKKKLVRRVPVVTEVERMIAFAKQLDPIMKY